MNKDEVESLTAYYNAKLESEGLGVIEIGGLFVGANYKHIKGKWRRLEAELNGVTDKRQLMDVSPKTATGIESDSPHGDREEPAAFDDYESGRMTSYMWESMLQHFSASPLEARQADRERGAIIGLDHEKRVIPLKCRRKPSEPGKVWRKRILDRIIGDLATDEDAPAFSRFMSAITPPHATADGGGGPLSYKGPITAPTEIEGGYIEEEISSFPEKVVDTHTYLPGRSPWQRSRIVHNNSDITG